MKRVKLFSAINPSDDWDNFQKIGEAISEWTEISDEEFGALEKYRYNIEWDLRQKKVLSDLETLVIIREFSEEDLKKTMISVSDIISSVSAKEKARQEKEATRRATIESRKKKRELAQLKKLQDKWGEAKDESETFEGEGNSDGGNSTETQRGREALLHREFCDCRIFRRIAA